MFFAINCSISFHSYKQKIMVVSYNQNSDQIHIRDMCSRIVLTFHYQTGRVGYMSIGIPSLFSLIHAKCFSLDFKLYVKRGDNCPVI